MLALFPSLLSFQLLAPFILRLTLGAILVFWSYKTFRNRNGGTTASAGEAHGNHDTRAVFLAIIDIVIGLLFIIGFLTQFAALLASIILLAKLVSKARAKSLFTDGVNYYFILLVIALSLLVTGPGFFAFDMPL